MLPLFRYRRLENHVAGKEKVRQAVVIDITDGHSPAVVHVGVG